MELENDEKKQRLINKNEQKVNTKIDMYELFKEIKKYGNIVKIEVLEIEEYEFVKKDPKKYNIIELYTEVFSKIVKIEVTNSFNNVENQILVCTSTLGEADQIVANMNLITFDNKILNVSKIFKSNFYPNENI